MSDALNFIKTYPAFSLLIAVSVFFIGYFIQLILTRRRRKLLQTFRLQSKFYVAGNAVIVLVKIQSTDYDSAVKTCNKEILKELKSINSENITTVAR